MARWRFLLLLTGVLVVVLSWPSIGFAQGANDTSAQVGAAPVESVKPQLPDTPAPSSAPSPSRSSEIAEPEATSSWSSSSSSSSTPRFWTSKDPNAQVTVLEDTLLQVMTNEPLSTRHTPEGALLLFTLSEDVVVDGVLIIPRGATIRGTVVESKPAGTLTGRPELVLKLTSLDLGGRSYPLYTYQFKVEGASKTKPTETKIKGGAAIGAIVGGIFSGSAKGETTAAAKFAGMGTGAALGAGVGTAVSAAIPGPILTIPAESQMDFYLASPISVVPVSPKEAARLSQGLHRGGPALYVRGDTP